MLIRLLLTYEKKPSAFLQRAKLRGTTLFHIYSPPRRLSVHTSFADNAGLRESLLSFPDPFSPPVRKPPSLPALPVRLPAYGRSSLTAQRRYSSFSQPFPVFSFYRKNSSLSSRDLSAFPAAEPVIPVWLPSKMTRFVAFWYQMYSYCCMRLKRGRMLL